MNYVRVFADSDGESHFEDCELAMPLGDLGTANVPKIALSKSFDASKIYFVGAEVNRPEHRDIDWHTAPARQFVIWLKGEIEITVSDGAMRRFGPGDVVLAEDTTGKGHRSLNLEDVLLAFVPLAE